MPTDKLTLNIIGCGKLGKTLARLWAGNGCLEVQDICNRKLQSAHEACRFVGAGRPVASIEEMSPADCWLIATPDEQISSSASLLAQQTLLQSQHLVFHCSGSLGSEALSALRTHTELLASVHPLHSFANPETSVTSFAGSYCAYEGNSKALQILVPFFSAVGSLPVALKVADKAVYHAASVIACNYLVGLLDASIDCYRRVGIDADTAAAMLRPLVHQTVDNVLTRSPEEALTGPLARGDVSTIENQLVSLERESGELATLYKVLGNRVLQMAMKGKDVQQPQWQRLRCLLNPESAS